MSKVAVTPMTRQDIRRVMTIEEASFPEPWSESLMLGELALRDSRRYTKASDGREVLGYLGLMFVSDEVHVNTIATRPGSRSRGVATSLLLEGIHAATVRGAKDLTLEVAVSNLRAQRLYARFGLAPVGVRRGYYLGGEDALVMWCRDIGSAEECERRAEIAMTLGS